MPRLIITRGLPASGKSTAARSWVGEDPAGRARINKDDLRALMHASVWLGDETEKQIVAVRDASVTALLKRGIDVIADDTYLPNRAVKDLRRLAVLAGAEFEVRDMTNIPLDECLRRNACREDSERVPEDRIRHMYQRYIEGRPYPLPLGEVSDEIEQRGAAAAMYVPSTDAPRAVIVDIDGTVALRGARNPYDESRVSEDSPNLPVIEAVRATYMAGYRIVFCSGRTEACRDETEEWISHHVPVFFDALHMREVGDTRKDSVIKAEIFDREIRDKYNVLAVFDDRKQVVDMWRGLGLTVFQVAPGDF